MISLAARLLETGRQGKPRSPLAEIIDFDLNDFDIQSVPSLRLPLVKCLIFQEARWMNQDDMYVQCEGIFVSLLVVDILGKTALLVDHLIMILAIIIVTEP